MDINLKKIITLETKEQLESVLNFDLSKINVEFVYITSDTFDKKEYKTIIDSLHTKNVKVGIRLSRLTPDIEIIKSFFYGKKDKQNDKPSKNDCCFDFDSIMIRNIDQFAYILDLLKNFKSNGFLFDSSLFGFYIHFDWSLNVYNNETKKVFISTIDDYINSNYLLFTYNLEQNTRELKLLNMDDIVFYGYVPVMVTCNCILKSTDKCLFPTRDFNNESSAKNSNDITTSGKTTLVDRKGEILNVKTYCKFCYNQIFNPVPIFLCDMRDDLTMIDYKYERYDFTIEGTTQVKEILLQEKKPIGFTRGHIKRGIE